MEKGKAQGQLVKVGAGKAQIRPLPALFPGPFVFLHRLGQTPLLGPQIGVQRRGQELFLAFCRSLNSRSREL